MVDLPEMPARIARLPRDHRGFPVPWFVAWIDGVPDFRAVDTSKLARALRRPHCWVCGDQMGVHRVFVIGPMCAINRVISEPPSHRECAEFTVKACPFLSRPRMRRNEKDLPDKYFEAPGFHLDRNPGAVCLWETPTYKPFQANIGDKGVLFRLGDPARVDWWAEGRAATREEVLASIEGGYPELWRVAVMEGSEAMSELAKLRERAMRLLPP